MDTAGDLIEKAFQCGKHIMSVWNKSGNKTNYRRAKGCNHWIKTGSLHGPFRNDLHLGSVKQDNAINGKIQE